MNIRQAGSNMTELQLGRMMILFSYNTPVAAFVPDRGWVRTEQYFSVTTSKHINKWLDGCKAESVPQEYIESLTS